MTLINDNADGHLIETRLSGDPVFTGSLLHVKRDQIRLPDGGEGTREYVVHPGAAVIIPVLPGNRLVMERQYRYPIGRVLIEFPAGKLDPGEQALATAQRELLEETGYRALEWDWIATVHPIVSYSTERIEIFLAQELVLERAQLDAGEFLETFIIDFAEAWALLKSGRITDAKTIVGLFHLRERGFA